MKARFQFTKNPVIVDAPDSTWVIFLDENDIAISYILDNDGNFILDEDFIGQTLYYVVFPAYINTANFDQLNANELIDKLSTFITNLPEFNVDATTDIEENIVQEPAPEGYNAIDNNLHISDTDDLAVDLIGHAARQIPKNYWVPVYGNYIYSLVDISLYDGTDIHEMILSNGSYKIQGLKGRSILCITR